MAAMLKFQTSDKQTREVEEELMLKASGLVRSSKEAVPETGEEEEEEEDKGIPLYEVTSAIFDKVHEWVLHHKDDPEPDPNMTEVERRRTDNIDQWDRDFFNVDDSILFGLILASNYLDIKPMYVLGCKTVANIIKKEGTAEKIRERFGIVDDLTAEEKKKIQREFEWHPEDDEEEQKQGEGENMEQVAQPEN